MTILLPFLFISKRKNPQKGRAAGTDNGADGMKKKEIFMQVKKKRMKA